MRGFAGFVLDALLPAVFATLFASGILFGMRKAWREPTQTSEHPQARVTLLLKGIISLFAFVLFIAVMLGVTYSAFRLHYKIWALHSQDVREIRIGDHQFTDQPSIEMVIRDLKSSEWYSVNHGGWGVETPMVLTMNSGTRWYMQVGYHFTQHGAVIVSSSAPHGSGWNYGQVFSAALPGTLEKLGVPLSHCDKAHDHPCKTAQLTSP